MKTRKRVPLGSCSGPTSCGSLEIEPLRGAFLFLIKNIFFRFFEVFVCYFHPTFSQGHQTSFCTDCLDVSTREVIFSHDQVVQCHIIGQRHSARVDLKDALLGLFVWQGELDLPVNAACMQVERLSVTALCSPRLCPAQEVLAHLLTRALCQCPLGRRSKS